MSFPTGVGARGSSGVAGVVKNTVGALTYVDVAYSLANKFQFALMKNRAGKFTTPGLRGIQAALSKLPDKVTAAEPAEDRRSAEGGRQPRLPDRHVHVRDRADQLVEGGRPQEVHLLGRDLGPEVRPAAALPAAAEDRCRPSRTARSRRSRAAAPSRGATSRMTTVTHDPAAPGPSLESRGIRLGDVLFRGVAVAAAAATTALLGLIAYQVVEQAWPAIEHFGLSFVWTEAWDPVKDNYGALTFVYGTVVTSVIALLLATPLSIAIALFLTEIAPRRIAAPIATMVELLAAIPSVVLGLWGILVFGPWVADESRAVARGRTRLHPDLRRQLLPGGDAAGRARPDDHDRPDHVGDLPRALRPHAA